MSSEDIDAYESIIDELYQRYLLTPKDSENLIQYIKNNYQSEVIPKIICMIENHILLGVYCQKQYNSIKIIIRLGELTEIKPQYNVVIERSFKLKDSKTLTLRTNTLPDPIFKLLKQKYKSLPQNCDWSYKVHDHIDVLIK